MKKYFYGIKEIEMIYNGDYSDPTLVYKGIKINYYAVEDTLYERYKDSSEHNQQSFDDYVKSNKEDVLDLMDELI